MNLSRCITSVALAAMLLFIPFFVCHLAALDMAKQSIIASRTNERGFQTWLAVDQDDVIHEIVIDPDTRGCPVLAAILGIRLNHSGDLVLSAVLPTDKVAIAARRISMPRGVKFHVILAWGFSSVVFSTDHLQCHLYVFREEHGQVTQSAHEELGERLIQFIVEDLNNDGNVEILVNTGNYGFQNMVIWQILTSGEVKRVQLIDGDRVSTLQDRFLDDHDLGIVAETKAEKCPPGLVCYNVMAYKWFAQEGKFIRARR